MKKQCFIIAGPNGAGKTTFANELLPKEAGCLNFINADLIAQGLSPFQPSDKAIEAGRLMIRHINESIEKKVSFAFETTLSGRGHLNNIKKLKNYHYEIIIYYLKLPSMEFAIDRVRSRVSQGGHNIHVEVIKRRYERSWINFQTLYRPLADSWIIYDTSDKFPQLIEKSKE